MRNCIFSMLAATLMLGAGAAHAYLDKDWRQKYTPSDEWQVECAYEESRRGCPGALTYFYRLSADQSANTDAIIMLLSSRGFHQLAIAPYNGDCSGGYVSIDGKKSFDLENYSDHCRVAGDLFFRKESFSTKPTLQIGMLENASQVDITMTMADGESRQIRISMAGFNDAFAKAKEMTAR